jgi:hypothetical protein
MDKNPKKCRGCKEHNQYLTPETWLIVQEFKSQYDELHPRPNGLRKSDAVNLIITEWKELKLKLKDAKN